MERCTKKDVDGRWYVNDDSCYDTWDVPKQFCGDAIDRLAHYEDLEEQGRLVKLPCKPSEEVWIWHNKYGLHRGVYTSESAILSDIENGYVIAYTRAEAEAALKGV